MPLTTLLDVVPSTGDPSTPAIIIGSGGPVYSRAKIRALALRFAARLRDAGIIPGDVVTIAEPNTLAYVVAFLGITWTRAIAAPLNQNYTTDEFRYYMQDAGSRLLVVGPDGNPNAEAAEAASVLKITPEMLHIDDKEAFESARQAAIDPPQAADVALFLHTSGTTSKPKGVPLTHGNLVASITNITQTYEFTPEDVSLLVMPLFHVHGLMAGWLSPMAAGAVVVLPAAGKFSASSFWKDASTYRVTYYTAVPTMHQVLVARAEKDFPNAEPPPLRVIRSCSSSLAPATLHQVEAAFGAPVLEVSGRTERLRDCLHLCASAHVWRMFSWS
jgi:oxalate---CoA ligase